MRTLSGLSPSIVAIVLLSGYTACVEDQTVAPSVFTSATAHAVAMDACMWYGCMYVARTTFAASFSLASTSPESTDNASRVAVWLRKC